MLFLWAPFSTSAEVLYTEDTVGHKIGKHFLNLCIVYEFFGKFLSRKPSPPNYKCDWQLKSLLQ